MSHRNLPNTPQRYTHSVNCGCMRGDHIWDLEYDKEAKNDRWCLCCEHFYLNEEAEDMAADAAIIFPGQTNPSNQPSKPISSGGLNKGVIRRRS